MLFALAIILFLDHCLASNPWTPEPANPSWTNWTKRHEDLLTLTQQHGKEAQVIFIGDSITEGWTWDQKSRDIWAKHYTPRHAYNYGIGGDRTEHVLWRIEHKEFDGINPKVAVLMIGISLKMFETILKINFILIHKKEQTICGGIAPMISHMAFAKYFINWL